jgi:hypothetical protein
MSEPSDRPKVRLRSASQVLPVVTVDCNDWPRSEGPRSRVRLQSAAQHLPPVAVDCSAWDRASANQWLEIRVRFEADADPAAVEAVTVKLIHTADAAAPELGLTFDKARSGVDGGEVVVALTPTNPVGAADRLAEIARTIATAPRTTAAWRKAG